MVIKRSISSLSLLFASVSAILGSGWLFTAYYTSQLAGPASIISWIIGGALVTIVAFTFAEISAMLPITGASTRFPQYTHGTIVSFIFSWMIWLSYMTLAPTEVQAVMQYLSYFFVSFTHLDGSLNTDGYLVATGLMLLISIVNTYSVRWLLRCNTAITYLKIGIPIFIAVVVLFSVYHPGHIIHAGHSPFIFHGVHGILAAITSGGIIFAFNGFKQAADMAGEARNPNKTVPIAIIGSIALTLFIYLLLQICFLSSLTSHNILHGWHHLYLHGGNSPFSAILYQNKQTWLLPLLYIGAIIGPLGAAFMYACVGARALYGTTTNGYLPLKLTTLNSHGNPVVAIIVNFLIGMLMFAPLPGWNKMATFLTSLMAITYAIAPLNLLAFRKQIPNQKRPFKLKHPWLIGGLSFYICNLLSYWSGWDIISKLGIALIAGFLVLFIYHFTSKRGRQIEFNWRASLWIWPFLLGTTLISYLGNFGHGLGVLPLGWDFVVIAAFSIVIMLLAVHFRLPNEVTQQYIRELELDKHR